MEESGEVTVGGVILPDSAKERPLTGTVVALGPGKVDEDGERKAPRVKEGDRVIYFKWVVVGYGRPGACGKLGQRLNTRCAHPALLLQVCRRHDADPLGHHLRRHS